MEGTRGCVPRDERKRLRDYINHSLIPIALNSFVKSSHMSNTLQNQRESQ